jgi:hypothetical protein
LTHNGNGLYKLYTPLAPLGSALICPFVETCNFNFIVRPQYA